MKTQYIKSQYPQSPNVIIQSAPNTIIEISARIDVWSITGPTTRLRFLMETEYNAAGERTETNTPEYSYRIMSHMEDTLARWTNEKDAIRYHGEEAVKKAYRLLDEIRKEEQRRIKAGRKHPAYNDLAEIAARQITGYHADFFYHDIRQLAEMDPRAPFIWIMKGDAGTWLIQVPTPRHKMKRGQKRLQRTPN